MRFSPLAWLLGAWASAWGEDSCVEGPCLGQDEQSLVQLRRKHAGKQIETKPCWPRWPADRYDLSGKSVYLVMTDRFNRVDPLNTTENPDCITEQNWCGGTLKGITEKVGYIKGMGFDAIWVTPVVKQSPLKDAPPPNSPHANECQGSGWSYHGYWAEDYYRVDPHFGSEDDLKELVDAVHTAGMTFILDIVLNHMRPIHQQDKGFEVEGIKPFNDKTYYHQVKPLDRPGGDDWDAYTERYCNWPSPMQALGPGTLCYLNTTDGVPDYTNNGNYCNNYKGNPFGTQEYNKESYLGKDAAGPPSLKYCGPGNYCKGYNQTRIWEGWFYDLGDLNHSIPFVMEMQFEWIRMMGKKYDLDGIRLDTAPYMPWWYLKEFQEKAHPLQILGEVTTSNVSFHASFQHDKKLHHVLAGLENFPAFYMATPGYCNDTGNLNSPIAMGTLEWLGTTMKKQIDSALYTNLLTLTNFMDNQDYSPISDYCKGNVPRIKNGLTWVFMTYGMPVVTWGTEQGNTVYRQTLWSLGFDTTTWQYQFIKKLNWVRKRTKITTAKTEVVHYSKSRLVFVRGSRKSGVWVFTNNFENKTGPVVYRVGPPCHFSRHDWRDAISGEKPRITKSGHVIAPNSDPVVLYRAGKGKKEILMES
mmetsp:Transcript_106138/g.295356  ORF Transcript_106138/g.295356 Transcript_106138/m.295356 type:complete len:640 (-) Transcript_106138:95-2014(-)|eukprot:CAMPEP_0179187048 /NCGR_PEP_ID=MMETSP0796-20121207/92799_1 /TAXON_ID=73915 /ORGANISM="Pyrodinium bahamense, Strain pbaha01" /LENGTH=639 /DNA_ID=CAMNT_0020891087 /DNA_START=60 /DNA_END=1979 /DNA_ORIENTATION=-